MCAIHNNQLLHLGASAMKRMITAEAVEAIRVNIGPNPITSNKRSSPPSFWVFAQMLDLMITAFDIPVRDPFDDVYARGMAARPDH